MWLHVWWLTLLLEFTLAEPKGRFFYGLKHVHVTEDTCAVIIGQELRKTETAFRRVKVSAPCFDGPYAFGFVKNPAVNKGFEFRICYVESGFTLKCWSNHEAAVGFSYIVFSTPVASCGMDRYDNVSIAVDGGVILYSPTHICKCDKNGCGNKIPMIGACPVKEIDQCTCNNRIMSYGGIMCRRSETGFFYLKDGTNMWEYVFWPRYDYFIELDTQFYQGIQQFVLFNHIVKDDICTISAGDAFELTPFYYFDTVVMREGKYEHVCLDQEAQFAVSIMYISPTTRIYGCFLSSNGQLQCGIFINSYFVHRLDSHLDLSLCKYSTTDYFLSLEVYVKESRYLMVQLCSKNFIDFVGIQCCSYNISTSMNQDLEFKKARFVGIQNAPFVTVFRLNGTQCAMHHGTIPFLKDIIFFTAKSDAIALKLMLYDGRLDRLYGIAYVKKKNYCLLEYRQPNHLIQDYSIPCMPETGLKLFHVTILDKIRFVEVCHYSMENHSITCYDHYTNATSLYSLRGCTLYSKGDANYLFGYGTEIRIGDELSACTIERIDPGQFALKTQSIVDGLNDPPLLKIRDAFYAANKTLSVKSLEFMDATGFDHVCGTTMIKTDECSYFYDNTTNEFHALSEGFDYTFILQDSFKSIYIPDPERRCPDYEPRLHAYHCYIVLAIDVVLLVVFVVVVVFEIKGFRLFKFAEIRQELIEKKKAIYEANEHYYF